MNFAPLIAEQLRAKRRGQARRSWYVDETSIRVKGKWCYLYRAIDADGNLVDSRRSEKRDMEAAKCFYDKPAADGLMKNLLLGIYDSIFLLREP